MKYIILKAEVNGIEKEFPVIFPNDLIHSVVSDAFKYALNKSVVIDISTLETVAAGFVSSVDLNVHPIGKSESLGGLSPRSRDRDLIMTMDYCHGDHSVIPFVKRAIENTRSASDESN